MRLPAADCGRDATRPRPREGRQDRAAVGQRRVAVANLLRPLRLRSAGMVSDPALPLGLVDDGSSRLSPWGPAQLLLPGPGIIVNDDN